MEKWETIPEEVVEVGVHSSLQWLEEVEEEGELILQSQEVEVEEVEEGEIPILEVEEEEVEGAIPILEVEEEVEEHR